MTLKEKIEGILAKSLPEGTIFEVVVPPQASFGHYSTSVAMRLAKMQGHNPVAVANELAGKIRATAPDGLFEKVEVAPPGFVNVWVSSSIVQKEFAAVASKKSSYGKGNTGKGKKIIVEYSSPNVLKPLHVGHFRNTVLGDAFANIYKKLGYKVIRWNYLGDWGTQFGKLIAAYKLWGNKKEVAKDPMGVMNKLYVQFNTEEANNPELAKQGRDEFRMLEEGNKESRKLWEWFRKESVKEFTRLYRALGVKFDTWTGESFFEAKLAPLVDDLIARGIAKESEGAIIISLDEFNLPPGLLRKSDGGSLYLTRDIANLEYRLAKFKPAKILYVIGNEQSLAFQQLFAIAKKLGLDSSTELVHLKYGLVLGESGKKFSTRKGNTVSFEELLARAVSLTEEVVAEKNKDLSKKEKTDIARAVGLGAIKYAALKENRNSDMVFDWDKILDFRGDSGPYLQYTYARLMNIKRKAGRLLKVDVSLLVGEEELGLMRKLFEFPNTLQEVGRGMHINLLTMYLYELANAVNRFYESTPILKDDNKKRIAARVLLIETVATTIESGLKLLNIETPKKV